MRVFTCTCSHSPLVLVSSSMGLCPAHIRSHIWHVFNYVNMCAQRHVHAFIYVRVQLCALKYSPLHLCSNARTHTRASPASRPNTCARARRRAPLPTSARVSAHTCAPPPTCTRVLRPRTGAAQRPPPPLRCPGMPWRERRVPGAPCDRQGVPREGTGHHPAVPWSIRASWNRLSSSSSSTATCSRARPSPPRGCPKSTGNYALANCQRKHCIHLLKCCDPYMHPGGRVQALTPTQPKSTGSRRHLPTAALQVSPVPQGYSGPKSLSSLGSSQLEQLPPPRSSASCLSTGTNHARHSWDRCAAPAAALLLEIQWYAATYRRWQFLQHRALCRAAEPHYESSMAPKGCSLWS